MLILTRKSGEAIRIGDHVTLKIMEIRGGQVRIGIEAPRDISVHREEVFEQARRQNQRAAQSSPTDPERLTDILSEPHQSAEPEGE